MLTAFLIFLFLVGTVGSAIVGLLAMVVMVAGAFQDPKGRRR